MSDIELILEGKPRDLGGFTVGRVLPQLARRFVGPFLFLDHMGPADETGLAVRPHPHLHLATVTYLFEGQIMHRDSLGSQQIIQPGAINWMTAGRGIAHSERAPSAASTAHVHGLQIWVGLPQRHEDTAPAFQHTPVDALPTLADGGVQLRLLAGSAFGLTSPVTTHSPLFYADVRLAAGAELAVPAELADRAAYVIEGDVRIGDVELEPRHMAVLARGTTPVLRSTRGARLVVLGGEPLDGPRYMWWNFVSSSKDRIRAAAEDWRAGKFPIVVGDEHEHIPAPDGPQFAS